MGESQATMFQRAKQIMRVHPEWSLDEVADYASIPRAIRERIVGEARRELVTTENTEPFPS